MFHCIMKKVNPVLLTSLLAHFISEEGADYLPIVDRRIVFSENARHVCFNTTIMNDAECEELEFFSVVLSSSAPRVAVTPSVGHVIIHDPTFCSELNCVQCNLS